MIMFELDTRDVDCDIVRRYCRSEYERFIDSLSDTGIFMLASYVGNFSRYISVNCGETIELLRSALKDNRTCEEFWRTSVLFNQLERKDES